MLKGSKHENSTDPDGWCTADWSKNLVDLTLDFFEVLFEPNNGDLH